MMHEMDDEEARTSIIQPAQKSTEMAKEESVAAAAAKLELTVDEVVEAHVGSLGFSQLLHVFLVSLAWIFDSQNTLVTIFTDAQPPAWRCLPPPHASSSSSAMALCAAAARNGGSGDVGSVCGLVPGSWEWVGGRGSSIIAEWGLFCDHKFLAALPASLYFLGSLLGSAFYGQLADSWLGRKRSVLLACLLTFATAFLTSLSPNLATYALLRFANGFSRSGIGICCLVLSTEVVGRNYRGQVGQCGFFFFTAGFLSLPLIAYPSRTHWRNLHKTISVLPLLYSLFILPFVSESPRWLLIRGRSKEALQVLNKFARLNGRKLPQNLKLTDTTSFLQQNETKNLWTARWAAKRMAVIMVAGFGVGFVYYGVQLNVENLNFNLYFTVALNALMEIPAVFVGSVLLGSFRRRAVFSYSAYIAGVSSILCVFFSGRGGRGGVDGGGGGRWMQLGVEAVGFMAASMAFDVAYVYCVELFPTNVRNLAVSLLRQALMLGASMAPLLVVVGRLSPSLSFVIFGAFSIFSGILSTWLPETLNAPLYETLEQQEDGENLSSGCLETGIELGK